MHSEVGKLHSRAEALVARFQHGEESSTSDIEEAIILDREALERCPPGHHKRIVSLTWLAIHLYVRYSWYQTTRDIDEAILLDREALDLCLPGHPHRSLSMGNLVRCLSIRYNRCGEIRDLSDAIVLGREVLSLRPPGHPARSSSLNNLALHLFTRYEWFGTIQDLDEAIVHGQEALDLCPPGHPARSSSLNNLALHLFTRYERFGTIQDLDEAIVHSQEALDLCPPGHPDRSLSLNSLASCLSSRFGQSAQSEDREESFGLYTRLIDVTQIVSSIDVSAAKNWISLAERSQHSTLLLAYETSLRLFVQHVAPLVSPKNPAPSLALDAFSARLRHHSPAKAVELLEQGRGVFWSQLIRLRLPLAGVASGPAGKILTDQFSQLALIIRDALDYPGVDQHERVYHLNVEMQKVVTKIRELPGLSRFLLPPLFSDLRYAAEGGPVIVVNASKNSCDALIISLDCDPVHIPLPITRQAVCNISQEFRMLIMRAKRFDVTKDLASFLRKLWDQIVSPIVDFLQTTHPIQSRIWWCPTAEFSLLPLHAASPYRKGQQSLSDMYISSYTPTLMALIQARRCNPFTEGKKRFVAISQAAAVGGGELPSVHVEPDNIAKCMDSLATFTRIDGEESCVSRVAEELGKNEWVHLACHSIPNLAQPLESAFILHDGRFTIQRIISCKLNNPEFAYLSTNQATVGDMESPDEAIHLAAAMLSAGFRSVIGTMWMVDKGETNKITSTFYKHMVNESGHLDYTRAAYALNRTMRSVNVPLDQKIMYIHIGA